MPINQGPPGPIPRVIRPNGENADAPEDRRPDPPPAPPTSDDWVRMLTDGIPIQGVQEGAIIFVKAGGTAIIQEGLGSVRVCVEKGGTVVLGKGHLRSL